MRRAPIFFILSIIVVLSIIVALVFFQKESAIDFNTPEKSDFDLSLLISLKKKQKNTLKDLENLDAVIAGKSLPINIQIRVYDYKSYVNHFDLKDYKTANLYADSALNLMIGKDPKIYKYEIAMAYLCKGDVYYAQQKYNLAYPYYYKARKIGLDYFDDCIESEYSYRIAMIYYAQELYWDANQNFILANTEQESCQPSFDDYYRRQQVLSNIGLSFYMLQQYDSAIHYFNKALDTIQHNSAIYPWEEQNHKIAMGVVWGNLGKVYRHYKDKTKAKELFRKNISINLAEGGDINNAQSSYLDLAELMLNENELDSALLALNTVRVSLDTIGSPRNKMDWSRLMWLYFEKTNNLAEAHKYLLKYKGTKEVWLKSKKFSSKLDLKTQYDLFEKQHSIEKMEKDYEIRNLYLVLSLIIVLMITTLLVFIWISWKKSRNNLAKLNQLNKTILSQNKDLEIAFSNLTKSSQEKEHLLKIVAHDLRAPISSLVMMADLVLMAEDEQERNTFIELIKSSSENALNLVNETLNNSLNEGAKNPKTAILINDFMVECSNILKILAAEKKIQLLIELPKEEVSISLDINNFKRVINNLVINAIKFSSQKSKINLAVHLKDNFLIISIEDQGIGIPKEKLEQLFNSDASYNRSGTEGEDSYGLGLVYCKQVVEEHNGKLWIESTEGKGSTFFIKLPLEKN